MGDQKNTGMQNPGTPNPGSEQGRKDDQSQRSPNERAGQTPQEKQEKDRASNPSDPSEQHPNQDQQFDPNHIQKK
jgi:hypothetical protein